MQVTVELDDVRAVLRDGVNWTDDHGPTVRLADAANAVVSGRPVPVTGDRDREQG